MNKPYLIFVNGVLAMRKLTLRGAQKEARELEARGYSRVSVAEEFLPYCAETTNGIFTGGH